MMADDIDDLLDEVESKYCSSKAASSSQEKKENKSTKSTAAAAKKKPMSSYSDDLDDAINDIMADDGLHLSLSPKSSNSENQSTKQQSYEGNRLKCFSVYVGGSLTIQGVASTSNQRSCDRLHCTSCDNQIVTFDNFKWSEDKCDYLAFRNNYPDFLRLKPLLIPRKGYRAYCCQCSWLSVQEMSHLKIVKPTFKWVCRKH